MNPNWNERYGGAAFAYGKAPNEFFKTWLPKFEPGHILMPADGEGRNGVYAARKGWQVTSFDLSEAGRDKALKLAQEHQVQLEYVVGNFAELTFENTAFDAIGLIYAHFSADMKAAFHQKLDQYLRPGGIVILEAFSKSHLPYRESNPKVGGPNNLAMLYDKAEIQRDFPNYKALWLEEEAVALNEGLYHIGTGSVIRFVGQKVQD